MSRSVEARTEVGYRAETLALSSEEDGAPNSVFRREMRPDMAHLSMCDFGVYQTMRA